jgi:hypothetical protein
LSGHFFRLAVAGEIDVAIKKRSHVYEDTVLVFPVVEVAEVDHVLRIARAAPPIFPNDCQALAVGVRERPQQDCVHHTEERGVSADAER